MLKFYASMSLLLSLYEFIYSSRVRYQVTLFITTLSNAPVNVSNGAIEMIHFELFQTVLSRGCPQSQCQHRSFFIAVS